MPSCNAGGCAIQSWDQTEDALAGMLHWPRLLTHLQVRLARAAAALAPVGLIIAVMLILA